MGIKIEWVSELKETLKDLQIQSAIKLLGNQTLLELLEFPIVFNMLSASTANLSETLETRSEFESKESRVVNVWEDQWMFRKGQTIGRIKSIVGKNIRIGARNCSISQLSSSDAKLFFENNHLQGPVRAKCNIGLMLNGEIVAAAAFNIRPMNISPTYRSGELLLFCSKLGFTVVGGLSKLLKAYIQTEKPNDIMTYADKDWSRGHGYERLGFIPISETHPIKLYLNSDCQRISEKKIRSRNEIPNYNKEVFTTGNVKYILYL